MTSVILYADVLDLQYRSSSIFFSYYEFALLHCICAEVLYIIQSYKISIKFCSDIHTYVKSGCGLFYGVFMTYLSSKNQNEPENQVNLGETTMSTITINHNITISFER